MNIKKRIVSALMALVMTLSLVNSAVITAFAEGTQSADPSTGETQNAGYELRVLTFEDADYKGGTNFAGKSDWSSLIDSPQYGGSMLYGDGSGFDTLEKAYKWTDSGNTELSSRLCNGYGSYCYWSGGHAVSNYASSDYVTNGDFNHQLTVYKAGAEGDVRTGGGHNGSNNFAVHYGYKDGSQFNKTTELPALSFSDGMARVIDHMYVNNICYALNCYLNGNGLTANIGDDDWVKLIATGYDGEAKTGEASIYLCNGPKNIVTDWTKFDLSGLGAVTKVEFNVTGSSDNGYGFSQPAYFAYDDVAVRFDPNACVHTDENKDRKCDKCGADLNKAPKLVEGVKDVTDNSIIGAAYLLRDLQTGKIFEDGDDKLSAEKNYFYQRSTDNGQTWGEELGFSASLFGGTTISLTETEPGTYMYRFYAKDDFGGDSRGNGEEKTYWTLTLHVDKAENLDFDVNFYIGRDQNYKTNGSKLPIIKLWKSDGKSNKVGDEIAVTDAEDTKSGYNCMKATVKGGWYVYEGYGWNAETKAYDVPLGGMQIKLPTDSNVDGAAAGGTEIYLRLLSIYTTSKKVDGSSFTKDDFTVRVSCPIMQCDAVMGTPYVESGKTYYPTLFYAGGNACLFNVYYNPTDTETYIFSQQINQTLTAGNSVNTKSYKIDSVVKLTVTVPKTADFGLYFQYNNFYTAQQKTLVDWKDNGDNTKTAVYAVSKSNGNYTWRMTDTTGTYVTKGGWLSSVSKDTDYSFDFVNGQTNKLSHDFSQLGTQTSKRDEADLQVFVSASGAKALGSGTERIRAYRMWELIDSDAGNIMMEPDFVWTKLSGPATITYAEDAAGEITGTQIDGGNSRHNWADINANGGTSVFAVRYDAIDVDKSNKATHGGFYPATNPDRVNFFIVADELGKAEARVPFNGDFEANSRLPGWDYIYDTWYYLRTDTAPKMTFTTLNAVKVEYALGLTNGATMVSTVSDFTALTDAEGTYTVPLKDMNKDANNYGGTVIIRMTDKDGKYSYQLVKVAGVTANVENASNKGESIMPGDKVTLSFDGMYRSINKISGVFNPTIFKPRYTVAGKEVEGTTGQYQQMDTSRITFTVPEDIAFEDGKNETVLTATNGYVYGSMYSAANPFSTMYYMTDAGKGTNFNAVTVTFAFQHFADVEIPVTRKVWYNVELNITDEAGKVDGATVVLKDSDGKAIDPQEDGTYKLGYGSYTYSVVKDGYVCYNGSFKLGSADASSVQDGKLVKTAELVKAAEGAWDGKTATEPTKDANGVYQISNGAELAWFAQQVNKGGNAKISAVLTNDIELAGFEWTPIGMNSWGKKFAGSFDGQGHKISNLSIDYIGTNTQVPYKGLFGYVEGSSSKHAVIQNLTVQGNMVLTSSKNVIGAHSGGVIGRVDYADITNVHSEVNVTVKRVGGNWDNLGGLVGYANNSTTIKDCSNSGDVTGYRYAGGIAGNLSGNSSIINCTNSGNVTCAGSGAAGMAANVGNGCAITGCVNSGTIKSTGANVGGIAGDVAKAEISNCYNSGKIDCSQSTSGAVAGRAAAGAVIRNSYYAADTAAKGVGSAADAENQTASSVTAEDLKSADFVKKMNESLGSDVFIKGPNGPMLSWQIVVSVVAPETIEAIENGTNVTYEIYMNAAGALSCAQMKLAFTGDGEITEIKPGSGLELGNGGSFNNANNTISFIGNTASAANGILVATVTVRVDAFADEVKLTVSDAVAGISGNTADKAVSVMNADVAVDKVYTVSEAEFAPGLYLVTYIKDVPEGKSITCSGKGMLLADGNKTVTLMSGDAADKLKNSSFAVSDGAAVAVKYGDVNENSKINIVDAQIALDVGKGIYKDSDKVSVAGLLAADVNHDNVVDAKDAYSIQIYVHYNAFTVPAGN